jgi:hypothetical protein
MGWKVRFAAFIHGDDVCDAEVKISGSYLIPDWF